MKTILENELLFELKHSHTKESWDRVGSKYFNLLRYSGDPRISTTVYNHLKLDPQRHAYSQNLWEALIRACIKSENFELGMIILQDLPNPGTCGMQIAAAELSLESRQLDLYRSLIKKAKRHNKISDVDELRFTLIEIKYSILVEQSFVPTETLFNILEHLITKNIAHLETCDFKNSIADILFFNGSYREAAAIYSEAADTYKHEQITICSADCYFKAAISLQLWGGKASEFESFQAIEECKQIARKDELVLYDAVYHFFYGKIKHHQGLFAEAREYFQTSLKLLPLHAKLHYKNLVFYYLSKTHLKIGHTKIAQNYFKKIKADKLCFFAESSKNLFTALNTQILVEQGKILEAKNVFLQFFNGSFKTISSYSTFILFNRYQEFSANFDPSIKIPKLKIEKNLKKNPSLWLDFLNTSGFLSMSQSKTEEAIRLFLEKALPLSKLSNEPFQKAYTLLGITEICLKDPTTLDEANLYLRELEILSSRMHQHFFKNKIRLLHAAYAYKKGDWMECSKILQSLVKSKDLCFMDRFCTNAWLNVMDGHASKIYKNWLNDLLKVQSRRFFEPSIKQVEGNIYIVSQHYVVNLDSNPKIAAILNYLLNKIGTRCTLEDLQIHVWKQSIKQVGWQQKIRNMLSKLRYNFRFTMYPIILHDKDVVMDSTTIKIVTEATTSAEEQALIALKMEVSLSSQEISNKLNLSASTTKRILKKLSEKRQILSYKKGRRIKYTINPGHNTLEKSTEPNPSDLQ